MLKPIWSGTGSPDLSSWRQFYTIGSFMRVRISVWQLLSILLFSTALAIRAAEMPRLVNKNGHFEFDVDGHPYLILGAQIHNSSAWPSVLPRVWPGLEAMHVNTAEAPVYWEQIEAEPGKFDFS